ncbi:flagellar motor stator protein MotA [Sulfitobacter sp. R18_1]|uniref:flagellar motor stator protein MotA n=1 Tax=Sulfitobacter sp. R18_1 TaxID=2821104 RepID=UPI001ADAAC97|nr:flagellar motor stator protein MotA [Sulfitobacter sp. R18_1]MBO9428455.1 flagellar motor stator protein MotA [Sulfitobacter sp. R18_1]
MTLIVGFLVVLGMVFGGFMLAGGKFDIILHALPFEGMMIGGAAIGSFIIANSIPLIKQSLGGILKVMKGPKWKSQDYTDLLLLMFELTKIYKNKGAVGLDEHVEDPKSSEVFSRYPKIQGDHHAVELITDSFRMISMGFDDQFQVEDNINKKLKKHHHEVMAPAGALQVMSDGLPAIGIVAAVLGVIKTMASIDKPPAILGGMIGGALVGTFLGVFLSYCLVAPIASRLGQIEEDDSAFFNVIRDILIATVSGQPPAIAIELGRGAVPTNMQPNFYEIEQAQKELPS